MSALDLLPILPVELVFAEALAGSIGFTVDEMFISRSHDVKIWFDLVGLCNFHLIAVG